MYHLVISPGLTLKTVARLLSDNLQSSARLVHGVPLPIYGTYLKPMPSVIITSGWSLKNLANNRLVNKNTKIIAVAMAIISGIGISIKSTTLIGPQVSAAGNKTIIMHIHPHLMLTVDGKPVTLPAQIAINPSLWKDHSLDKYGMQAMINMFMSAMAAMGTESNNGIVGVPTSLHKNSTLQNFLKIWGIDLEHENVVIYVDGKPVTDFKEYVLRNGERLTMTIDGKPVAIPAKIGINPSLWKDHSLDKYGMHAMTMNMSSMAPLHTHETNGTIHVESNTIRPNTLGQFLDIWGGVDTNGKTVKATVHGVPVSDYRNIILRDKEQIELDVEK
jgi:sulfur carrier protein ThiS